MLQFIAHILIIPFALNILEHTINNLSFLQHDTLMLLLGNPCLVVVVNEHMPWDGLSWGRTYTDGFGGGKAR
jgi:hypothetical protein